MDKQKAFLVPLAIGLAAGLLLVLRQRRGAATLVSPAAPTIQAGPRSRSAIAAAPNAPVATSTATATTAPVGAAPTATASAAPTASTAARASGRRQGLLAATDDIVKSASDKRSYRHITLANGLSCLLISDPVSLLEAPRGGGADAASPPDGSQMAAAALSVRVGSFSNPPYLPGLAHFCEHMLFMGTAPFPKENEWEMYISGHGGESNAFTDEEHTVYHMEITPAHLPGALERFAAFFTSPLFDPSTVKREIRAVDSEFRNTKQNDYSRRLAVMIHSCKEGHPLHQFSWGNIQSLEVDPLRNGIKIREELLKFHSQYYSANAMKLAILDSRPLDALEALAVEHFSQVPNFDRPLLDFHEFGTPFGPETLAHYFNIVPVKECYCIALFWAVPNQFPNWQHKPFEYICHLLGHEGSFSLFAYLKAKGWIMTLSAGFSNCGTMQNSACWLLEVVINLSSEGFERRFDVIEAVFQYLALVKREGVVGWVWDEMKALADLSFRFEEHSEPMDTVEDKALNLQLYPAEHVLCGDTCIMHKDEAAILDALALLSPDAVRVDFVSKQFARVATSREPWFDVPFSKHPIPEDLLARWRAPLIPTEMAMPEPNLFLPTAFDLVLPLDPAQGPYPEGRDVPEVLLSDPKGCVWFAPDKLFHLPRGDIHLLLCTPAVTSPKAAVHNALFLAMLNDLLSEPVYPATLAELSYSVSARQPGIEIKLSGFSEKVFKLGELIVTELKRFPESARTEKVGARFGPIQEQKVRDYKSMYFRPSAHASYLREVVLLQRKWVLEDLIAEAEQASLADVIQHAEAVLAHMHIIMMAHGNFTAAQTLSFWGFLQRSLDYLPYEPVHTNACLKVSEGTTIRAVVDARNPTETNNAIENNYCIGWNSPLLALEVYVLTQLMYEPCFQALRTREQLGYAVSVRSRTVNQQKFIGFDIQSDAYGPGHCDERIEAFLVEFDQYLQDMTPEDYQKNINGISLELARPDSSISSLSHEFWMEITGVCDPSDVFIFDRSLRDAELVQSIPKETILALFRRHLLGHQEANPAQSCRRKVSLWVNGHNGGGKDGDEGDEGDEGDSAWQLFEGDDDEEEEEGEEAVDRKGWLRPFSKPARATQAQKPTQRPSGEREALQRALAQSEQLLQWDGMGDIRGRQGLGSLPGGVAFHERTLPQELQYYPQASAKR